MKLLHTTQSVCPVCLSTIAADLVEEPDGIYMQKRCPEHGSFHTLIWEGSSQSWLDWNRGNKTPDVIPDAAPPKEGCPRDCGLCSQHKRSGCCVLLELTKRCNLRCPVCFASAGEADGADISFADISAQMDWLMAHGGPFNLQLSGGEPTMRDDLPELIRLGLQKGFSFFQLNTNGIRLACERDYARRLKDAGLNTVFLQFDGLKDSIYQKLRGRPLLREKLAAIRRCDEAGLGVVLVPTVAPEINEADIGEILTFAEKHMPTVRGVHFQPISYFGRCSLSPNGKRITIPALLRELEQQTGGRIKAADFTGGGAENPYCSFHASYMKLPSGALKPLKKRGNSCCCTTTSAQSRVSVARQWSGAKLRVKSADGSSSIPQGFDDFLAEAHNSTLAVSGMLFQDAWNLDLERLQHCYICEADAKYGMVPFCAYNLTDINGRSLYRGGNGT